MYVNLTLRLRLLEKEIQGDVGPSTAYPITVIQQKKKTKNITRKISDWSDHVCISVMVAYLYFSALLAPPDRLLYRDYSLLVNPINIIYLL